MTRILSGLAVLAFLASAPAQAQVGIAFAPEAVPSTLTDVGFMSAPAIADLDGDGDLDAVVGTSAGTLVYFENQATAPTDPPVFVLLAGAASPFDGLTVGYAAAPTAANLDGDPEAEVLVGQGDGTFAFFDRSGGVFAPATVPTGLVDVGFNSTPVFGDFDGDLDLDVVSGRMLGTFAYFENTAGVGNPPAYSQLMGVSNPLDGVDLGFSSSAAAADLDDDGDTDLAAGDVLGEIAYLENTAGVSNPPVFATPLLSADVGFSAMPAIADLGQDGLLDALTGRSLGDYSYDEVLGIASMFVGAGGVEGYRALSLPYTDLPLGGRKPGFLATIYTAGYVGAARDQRNNRNLANVFVYDEPRGTHVRVEKDNPIRVLDAPAVNAQYEHGRGLYVFIFEDNDGVPGTFPKTLPAVGCPQVPCTAVTTDFTFPVTFTPASATPGGNLLGNPYDQDLNWDAPGWTKTDMSNVLEIYDPNSNGGEIRNWDGTAGTLPNGIIPTAQGFIVTATGAGAQLVAPASARTGSQGAIYGLTEPTTTAPTSKAQREGEGHLRLRLTARIDGEMRQTEALVTVRTGGALGADDWDAPLRLGAPDKTGLRLGLTTPTSDDLLAMAALPADLAAPVEVDLHLSALRSGMEEAAGVSFGWDASTLPAGWTASLLDRTSGEVRDLTEAGRLGVEIQGAPMETAKAITTSTPSHQPLRLAAHAKDTPTRFTLLVGPGASAQTGVLPKTEVVTEVGTIGPNPAAQAATLSVSLAAPSEVRVHIYDALGRLVARAHDGPLAEGVHRVALPVARLSTGTYVVRVEGAGPAVTRRLSVVR
ncbi:MAG: T9SS type A sorting domain-containing protein [Bacteroidota bacterium]